MLRMAGITRIQITGGDKDHRFTIAESCAPSANELYRQMFASVGMTLADGDAVEKTLKDDLKGRYDAQEGIDIILRWAAYRKPGLPVPLGGMKATMQEKILHFQGTPTVTFEEDKNSGAKGAWYYCTAQYYAVLYTTLGSAELRKIHNRPDFKAEFRTGIILSLPEMQRADMRGEIKWQTRPNTRDGRRNAFRYVPFSALPEACIVATHNYTIAESAPSLFAPVPKPASPTHLRSQLRAMPDFERLVLLSDMLAETIEAAKKKRRAV